MSSSENLTWALERADQPLAEHVFITRDDDRLFELARSLDASDAAGRSLNGAVVVIKGNIDIQGMVTTAGSRSLKVSQALESAPLVRRIIEAGGVPMGHANMSEFAFSGLGLNPHFGTSANGLNPSLVPGGSSSGCASAIALGIAELAIGSDTSGSTRVPAAYQGIFGYRPTMGRYDDRGIIPLAPSLDTPGPMARDLAGIRILDKVLRKVTSKPANDHSHRIVIPDTESLGPIAPEISSLLKTAQRKLDAAGWQTEILPIPVFRHVCALFARKGTLVAAEAPGVLSKFTRLDHPDLDPNVRRRIAQGLPANLQNLVMLQTERSGLQSAMNAALGEALMLMPTVPTTPTAIAAVRDDGDAFASENARALSLAMLGSFLNLPSLAMPAGGRKPGRSLSLCAATGRDDAVLDAAEEIEPLLMALTPEVTT
jgi:aspartyl-tRNA(Asn)/glutamyl-tRNA(Gln) amidotransferase subunit A